MNDGRTVGEKPQLAEEPGAGFRSVSRIDVGEIETWSHSDVGRVRSINQDRCGEFAARGYRLLVVADGLGGHAGGEHASRIAVETIGSVFEKDDSKPEAFLHRAFAAANANILRESLQNAELSGMGTTGVALLIGADGAWTANVGDSRVYRARAGQLKQLSEDHSVIAAEVRAGRITEAEARDHPLRNRLLRCLGQEGEVEIDVKACEYAPGDRFLLCSDGLWGVVDDQRILAVLVHEDPEAAAQILVDLANRGGGDDNITVQIARIPGQPESSLVSRWLLGRRRPAWRRTP